MANLRSLVPVVSVALMLVACGGGGAAGGAAGADDTSAQAVTGLAEGVEDGEPPYNGRWGLQYNVSVKVQNSGGAAGGGACSGASATQGYACASDFTSKDTAILQPLAATGADGAQSASMSGKASLGLLEVTLDDAAAYEGGSMSLASASGSLYWVDLLIPPAPDATHPAGTPIAFDVEVTLANKGEVDDCGTGVTSFSAQLIFSGDDLSITGGCSPAGRSPTRKHLVTSYGAASIPLEAILSVSTAASASVAAASVTLTHVVSAVHVTSPAGVAYTTASGACYGFGGKCQ